MKRIIVFAIVLVVLLLDMTACRSLLEATESSETSASVVVSESATPKPTPERTPEPTPAPRLITAYEELKEEDRAELEKQAEKLIDGQKAELYEQNKFQPFGIYGQQDPPVERMIGCSLILDSVFVLSGGTSSSDFENRVVFLYDATMQFEENNFGEEFPLYISVFLDNVSVDGSGKMENDLQDVKIDLILSSQSYDFYNLYEDAILAKESFYEINQTICDENHEKRLQDIKTYSYLNSGSLLSALEWSRGYVAEHVSGYPESYKTLKDGGREIIMYSSMRRLIEADVRLMNQEDLEMALCELYARNGGKVDDPQFDSSVFSDIERYNVAFLKHHIENYPVLEYSQLPVLEAPSEPEGASDNEITEDPETYWEEFLRNGYQQYISDSLSSELEYIITDVSEDGIPELLIQSTIERPFYTTWLFAVNQGEATLVNKRYGYGMYRYYAEEGLLVISPTTKPFRGAGEYPFYRLEGTQLTEVFGVGENLDGYYYRDETGVTMLSKEEHDAYFTDLTSFEWQPLAGSAQESESTPQENIEPAFDPVGIWKIDSYKMAENTDTAGYEVGSGATLMLMENGNITFDDKAGASFYGSWKPYDESRLYAKLKNRETEQEMVVYLWEEEASTGRKGIALEIEESGAVLYWKWFV